MSWCWGLIQVIRKIIRVVNTKLMGTIWKSAESMAFASVFVVWTTQMTWGIEGYELSKKVILMYEIHYIFMMMIWWMDGWYVSSTTCKITIIQTNSIEFYEYEGSNPLLLKIKTKPKQKYMKKKWKINFKTGNFSIAVVWYGICICHDS